MSTARTSRVLSTPPTPAVLVAAELELVEQRLIHLLGSRELRLSDISRHLIGAGGKRVRPAVTLLIFRACGGRDLTDIIDVAVALELIHSASLLHDDIIDGSHVRRGRDSALRRYGVADTLITGDFLFSRAFQICGRFDEKLINWAAEACIRLTEGEIMQGRFRRKPTATYSDYEEIITRKTASMFEAGGRTAAYLADASEDAVEAMARCGLHVGMTFQMIDDLLDVTAVEEQLGKPAGLDLRQGNPSLPVVLAMNTDPKIRSLFAKPALTDADIDTVLARLRSSTIIADGYGLATGHARKARDALRVLPDSAYRENLLALIDQLVDRVS